MDHKDELWYRNEVIHKPNGKTEKPNGVILGRTIYGCTDSSKYRPLRYKIEKEIEEIRWEIGEHDRWRRLVEYSETYEDGIYR